VVVFQDGEPADPKPWARDPNARAVLTEITAAHVRASAAIPFLFPSIRIGSSYYVDGGLRMNTPLSPALRLAADRVLVVALKHAPGRAGGDCEYPEDAITQPAFLLGKVLNALLLDQLEYELQRMELVNAWIARGEEVYGAEFLDRINVTVSAQRGVGYRLVKATTIRPSADLGALAAQVRKRTGGRELGTLPALLTRFALRGVPEDEADLLSYLYFDACFTSQLVELGREDARARHDEILELLLGEE
jgi:NTE family protein